MYVVFCDLGDPPGLKTKRQGLEKGVENDNFWSERGWEFVESGDSPHQEFPGVHLPTPPGITSFKWLVSKKSIKFSNKEKFRLIVLFVMTLRVAVSLYLFSLNLNNLSNIETPEKRAG